MQAALDIVKLPILRIPCLSILLAFAAAANALIGPINPILSSLCSHMALAIGQSEFVVDFATSASGRSVNTAS